MNLLEGKISIQLGDFPTTRGITTMVHPPGKASMRLNFPDDWLEGRRCSELHEGKEVSNSRWVNKAGSAETLFGSELAKTRIKTVIFLGGDFIIPMEVESLDWMILSG